MWKFSSGGKTRYKTLEAIEWLRKWEDTGKYCGKIALEEVMDQQSQENSMNVQSEKYALEYFHLGKKFWII